MEPVKTPMSSKMPLVYVRDLGPADLEALVERKEPAAQTSIPRLQKIRASHHLLARLIADGLSNMEVAAITGTNNARLSVLKDDPAFQELVEHYIRQKGAVYLDVHQRLSILGMTAIEELQDRLEDPTKAAAMPTPEVRAIMESVLDRGAAPQRTIQEHVTSDPARVAAEVKEMFAPRTKGVIVI